MVILLMLRKDKMAAYSDNQNNHMIYTELHLLVVVDTVLF
jgi:hypothetical protein